MFCSKCGKQIEENEVCSCQNATEQTNVQENTPATETTPVVEETSTQESTPVVESTQVVETAQEQEPAAANLPSASEVMASASQIAANVGSNPIVSECVKTIKGVMSKNVVKTVGLGAGRTDILWIILLVVESIVNAFVASFSFRHSIYFYVKDIANKAAGFLGLKFKFSDMAEGFKALEMGGFKCFGVALLINLITFFVFVILLFLVMMMLKKKTTFTNVANLVAVAFLPTAIITAPTFLCSLFAPPVILILMFVGFLTTIPLLYLGMQKLAKFESSPFWVYVIYYAIAFTISVAIGTAILNGAFDAIASEFEELFTDALSGLL